MARWRWFGFGLVSIAVVWGCAGGGAQAGSSFELPGDSLVVNDVVVHAYAVQQNDDIVEVGIRVPFSLIKTPPTEASGPGGAFAALGLPQLAKDTTVFDHIEMQWEPTGHEPSPFNVPLFAVRGYEIPVASVEAIAGSDSKIPDASRIPAGYQYPGVDQTIAQVGVRALPTSVPSPLATLLAFDYWQNQMVSFEPIVTREALLAKQDLIVAIPRPKVVGKATRYPTRFRAQFNPVTNVYLFAFDRFVRVAG